MPGQSVIASSPGRVNLIGEHIDYNDGWVLPFAIRERTRIHATISKDPSIRIRSKQQAEEILIPITEVDPKNRRGDWSDYVAGTIWSLELATRLTGGLDIEVDGQVPLGAGLSSSAALECAIAFGLNHLFDLGYDLPSLAKLAQRAENEYVGVPCGIMDQAVSLMAKKGHALLLDCVDLSTTQVPFDLVPWGLQLLVIDTMAHHELVDGGYKERRDTCQRTLRELGLGSMRDLDLDRLESLANSSKSPLDDLSYRRMRHAVTEIARVHETVTALDQQDFVKVGVILDASHHSLRDDYEVSSPELDLAVESAKSAGALGARMVGGGFGGSAIALISSERVPIAENLIASAFREKGWHPPRFFIATPEDGSRIED
jgi:galactokinase